MEKKEPVLPKVEDMQEQEKFKKGDYTVHLFIEESKGLLPVTAEKNFNPVISVKCFGKIKCTRKLKDVTSGATSIWSEHLYFSQLNCLISDLETSKILIEVKDSRTLKDSLIGSYELDFTYVYFQPKHAILHQWIILSNPYSEDITIQRGLIKIGVNILHENDKAEDLTAKTTEETMMIPPQVNVKSMQLIVQIIKATGLPKMDTGNGTVDAYCVVSFATAKNRTRTETADKGTMTCEWYQEIWLPVCQPCIANKVSLVIMDNDTFGDDELVGSLSFNFDKIPYEENSKFMWANIFGAPENISNESAALMNTNDKLASHWRGRILLRLFKKDSEKATMKTLSIKTPEVENIVQEIYEVETDYQINAQVLEAVNLPNKIGNYSIVIRFANTKIQSRVSAAVDGCCKWYESIKRQVASIPDGSLLPDVFVYLLYDNKPICYARVKQSEINIAKPKEKWIKLTPDPSIGQVENAWEGGYVLLRLFVDTLDNKDYDKKFWEAKLESSLGKSTKKLVCSLYQCKNLPPADPTGLADPYVKVLCGASEYSTDKNAKEGILNPIWYESFSMNVTIGSIDTAPPIIIQVWDYDIGSSDDIMGICTIDMSTVPINPEVSPRPEWHKLSLGSEETEEGEILISFMIVDSKVPGFFMPELTEVSIDIYALGFRDLKPALGWLPVNKAFLKIDVGAIQMPGEQSIVTMLSTQPNSPGPNPNIGAVLSFKTKIPIDPLYCPNITCTVYDFLMSGKSQPILGTFQLNLHRVYSKKVIQQSFFKKAKDQFVKQIADSNSGTNPLALFDHPDDLIAIVEDDEEGGNPNEFQALLAEHGKNTVMPEVKRSAREIKTEFMPLSLSEIQDPRRSVVMPQFKPLGRETKKNTEVKFKDASFVPLGYNREANDGRKHYRYAIDTALEKSELFGEAPFETYPIKKGQSRGVTAGFFSKKSSSLSEMSTLTEAGTFKGLVRIKNLRDPVGEKNDTVEQIAKLLLVKSECVVRVYIIDAMNLEQKDANSPSDPYLVLKLGKMRISDRDNAIMDNANPKFLKSFDLMSTFPGESTLKIQVWDYNDLFSDDKIGTTKIDLEDRFFNESWKNMPEKPIEVRKLLVKSCKQPKGFIRLWIEIYPSLNVPTPWDLAPKPPEKFQLRVIVWRCEDVPNMDSEGVSDLYIVVSLNNEEKKETDTHYRAQSGAASWNWRMKFNMLLDENSRCILNFSLWDRDILSANDAIGDACLDLTQHAQQALETGDIVKKYGTSERISERALRKESEKFFINFNTKDENGSEKYVGKVLISVEIVPDVKAQACNNGEGRSEPNIEPTLPAPEGRVQFTMNPVKMMAQMVGPELKQKICMYAFLVCCAFLWIMMFPMIFANIVSQIFI